MYFPTARMHLFARTMQRFFSIKMQQMLHVHILGSVASFSFYEKLQATYVSFGVTIVAGEVNRGKTKSVELCLASLGARFSSISDALLRKLLHGGMPWCFDDPDTAEQLSYEHPADCLRW